MKHLLPFRVYESSASLSLNEYQEYFMGKWRKARRNPYDAYRGLDFSDWIFLNRYVKGTWRLNGETGFIDIQGDFRCSKRDRYEVPKGMKTFMGIIEFGNVTGNFICKDGKLRSLQGAPKKVGGDFYFRNNGLQSLQEAPQEVRGNFNCSHNELQSLKGAPLEVGGRFICSKNQLQSLNGAPQKVGKGFDCSENHLQSLKGAPKKVGGVFNCSRNELQSLEGAPKEMNDIFHCDEFKLAKGKWNMEGWLEVLGTGTEKAKKLILTLPYFQPELLNLELQKNPGKTTYLLEQAWKHIPDDMKSKIKIPPGYEDGFDLSSGFD
jgi:hypothetical protein